MRLFTDISRELGFWGFYFLEPIHFIWVLRGYILPKFYKIVRAVFEEKKFDI